MSTVQAEVQAAGQAAAKETDVVWAVMKQFSWVLIAVAILASFGYLIHMGVASYDKALAKADSYESQLKDQLKEAETQREADIEKLVSIKSQTQVIEKTIAANDTATQQKIIYVTKPEDTTTQVAALAAQYLPETPTVTSDDKLAFKPPTVQSFIATKIERDSLKEDNNDKDKAIGLANEKAALVQQELDSTTVSLADAEKTAAAFKKAAIKSKWQRLKGYAITGAIAVGAYEVGHLSTK